MHLEVDTDRSLFVSPIVQYWALVKDRASVFGVVCRAGGYGICLCVCVLVSFVLVGVELSTSLTPCEWSWGYVKSPDWAHCGTSLFYNVLCTLPLLEAGCALRSRCFGF